MRRDEFDHVLRAAGEVLGEKEIWIAGSQAILGARMQDLPAAAVVSGEVDVMPADGDAEKALRIHGAIGELTPRGLVPCHAGRGQSAFLR